MLGIVIAWFFAIVISEGREYDRFQERFNALEAEIKTYESVKILDARQEDRLEELLAELETYRPEEPGPVRPDPRF